MDEVSKFMLKLVLIVFQNEGEIMLSAFFLFVDIQSYIGLILFEEKVIIHGIFA